jgi:hypothetical protein
MVESLIGFLLMTYVLVFYFATFWELVYEVVELLTPNPAKKPQANTANK